MAKGSATPKRKTIFPDFLTLSGGTRKAILLLERRIQKTVFIFAGDFLIFRQLAGRSDSAAVPLFYIAEKAMRKEGTRFRREISGGLPGGILLSSKDFRLLAGRSFFFRRRKKNQERRHPFERVDDDLGALPPRPPPPINGRPSHSPLLPALPCRPGETFLVAAVKPYFSFAG